MTKNKFKHALFIASALGIFNAPIASAIVVIGSPSFTTDDSRVLGNQFTGVVEIFALDRGRSGTGVLISPTQILTAKHVTRDTGGNRFIVNFYDSNNVKGNNITTTAKYEVPDPPSNVSDIDGTDLSIITLPNAVTVTPMRLLSDMNYALGLEATMVGTGDFGVGNNPNLSFDNFRRAGTNKIDSYGAALSPGGSFANSTNIFSTDFDDGSGANNNLDYLGSSAIPLSAESTTARGDSGGPLLVQYNGEYLVAGILTGGSDPDSQYGDISWWTGVGPNQSLIESYGGEFVAVPIPEPSSVCLLGAGSLLIFLRRKR